MSRNNGRTIPFAGFSRGIPIVGGKPAMPAQPKGLYFYQIPVLIRREGMPLDADAFECKFPAPLEGVRFKGFEDDLAKTLKEQAPDLPAPRVILPSPIFLGFVPQAEIDRVAAAANEEAAKA